MSPERRMIVPPGELAPEERAAAAREARRQGITCARRFLEEAADDREARRAMVTPWCYSQFVLADVPEEAQRPWAGATEEALLADPRVCAFADGFERESARLVARPAAPRDPDALEACVEIAHRQCTWAQQAHRSACRSWAAARPRRRAAAWEQRERLRRLADEGQYLYQLTLMLWNAARHAAEVEA